MIIRKKNLVWFLTLTFLYLMLSREVEAESLEIDYHPASFTSSASLKTTAISDRSYLPLDWQTISAVYNYAFETKGFYDPSRPMTIKLSYDQLSSDLKTLFAFDWASRRWVALPTVDNPVGKYVTVETKSTMDRIVLMSRPGVMSTGQASWYKYKNGLFAASPDYVKGSLLRVHNTANGKFVDVIVNDFGPERDKHPDRVIDLDYVAFSKLASPGAGLISVRVEPLKATVLPGKKPSLVAEPAVKGPVLTASSAVLFLEKDGSVLWGKSETSVAPLASLTKLVAAKVFLETKPDLKKIVSYSYQDEAYNYEHVKPQESARLRVKEGETMSVEDLLYSTLVGSANNAAESLVRVSGLSRSKFIDRMNSLAKEWGAGNTKFIEPSGLAPQNVSSPLDYAIIAKEALADPLLAKISSTKSYFFKTRNTENPHTLNNTNQLLKTASYEINGSKTGYLDEAGYCLMTRVSTAQGNVIAVNFGSKSKAANFSDNDSLIKYGQSVLNK